MNNLIVKRIKRDFRQWSGGFSPESGYQITVYIDYALQCDIDPVEAKNTLLDWMNADDPDEDLFDNEPDLSGVHNLAPSRSNGLRRG